MLRAAGEGKRTPRTSESGLVDVEFGFGETTGGDGAAGIDYLLNALLGFEKLVDLSTQGKIFPADDFFGDHSENERGIADPAVEIVRVNGVRAGDDDSSLMSGIAG